MNTILEFGFVAAIAGLLIIVFSFFTGRFNFGMKVEDEDKKEFGQLVRITKMLYRFVGVIVILIGIVFIIIGGLS